MNGVVQLRNRALESPVVGRVLARAGIHPRHYRLLIDLFDTLAERNEIMGRTNTVGLGMIGAFGLLMSFFSCLFVFFGPSLPAYVLVPLGLTMYQLFVVVTGDAANSLLNPQEAYVLARFPIGGLTYAAAKATHLVVIVFIVVTANNIAPAVAGLLFPTARWFFPFTHMLAAYMAGFFIAFGGGGAYGWLYHFVAPERLKGIAMAIQLSMMALIPVVSGLAGGTLSKLKSTHLQQLAHWAWFPPNWFISIALMGNTAPGYPIWQGALAAAGTGLFLATAAVLLLTTLVTRFSLRHLTKEFRANLTALALGPSRLFKPLDSN